MIEQLPKIEETIDLTASQKRVGIGYVPDTVGQVIGELAQRRDQQRVGDDREAADRTERQIVDMVGMAMRYPRDRAAVDPAAGTIMLEDGTTYDVRSEAALLLVAVLIKADGDWMTEAEVREADTAHGQLQSTRMREAKQRLPVEVRKRVESGPRGYRWAIV